jgi:hypothetical protein
VPGMPQRGDSCVARTPPEARLRAPVTVARASTPTRLAAHRGAAASCGPPARAGP